MNNVVNFENCKYNTLSLFICVDDLCLCIQMLVLC